MLNFGASKPRVKGGGPGPRGPPLDPHLLCLLKSGGPMRKPTKFVHADSCTVVVLDALSCAKSWQVLYEETGL